MKPESPDLLKLREIDENWVSLNQLKDWVGSDHMNTDELLCILHDLINGQYAIEDFKNDVLFY